METQWASQVAQVVKNLPASIGDARDVGSILALGTSLGGGHGNPLQYSLSGKVHEQRSLAGYSPWGHTESDMTEHAYATPEEQYELFLYTSHLIKITICYTGVCGKL